MPLQVVNISNSEVKFVDESKNPVKTLEKSNAELLFDSMTKDIRIEDLEKKQANLTFDLIMNGVL